MLNIATIKVRLPFSRKCSWKSFARKIIQFIHFTCLHFLYHQLKYMQQEYADLGMEREMKITDIHLEKTHRSQLKLLCHFQMLF